MDNTKKEIIREMARIWLSLSRIGALLELKRAKCEKCGKCAGRRPVDKAAPVARKKKGGAKTETERLPDVPDWRDTEAAKRRDAAAQFDEDDKLTQIRLIVASHQGKKLSKIIEAILADGTDLKTLAQILGVNKARISEAKHGHARPGFVARFCEVLGEGGAAGAKAANSRTGRTGRTGRTNAGSKAEGK